MNEQPFSSRPPLTSVIRILLLVLFGFVIVGPAIGLAIGALFYSGDLLTGLSDPLGHPEIRTSILVSQGIAAGIGLILLPWFYLKFSEHVSVKSFLRNELQWPLLTGVIIVSVIAMGIALSPVVEWNAGIQFPESLKAFGDWVRETEEMAADLIKAITTDLTPGAFAFTFFVVAILPAFGEELVFRGMIQTEVARLFNNPHVGIWITSILFSAFHMQFMGFVPRVLIGAFLGYLYFWSGNLWIPILGHFFNNGLQLIGLYLYQKGLLGFDIESTESAPLPIVALSIAVAASALIYLKKYFQSPPAALDTLQ